jgi:hypothetical protein
MGVDAIHANAERLLAASLGASAAPSACQLRKAAADPVFVGAYPNLVSMCCESTTRESQDSARHFLGIMLNQLRRVRRDGGRGTDTYEDAEDPPLRDSKRARLLDDASQVVGYALAERYLPPPPPPTANN